MMVALLPPSRRPPVLQPAEGVFCADDTSQPADATLEVVRDYRQT